jgi:hypothetical protein
LRIGGSIFHKPGSLENRGFGFLVSRFGKIVFEQ